MESLGAQPKVEAERASRGLGEVEGAGDRPARRVRRRLSARPRRVRAGGGTPDAVRAVRGAVVDWRKPDPTQKLVFECIDLGGVFNDRVTQVFKNEYRSPRSPYCSMQIPLHGFGDWCYGGRRAEPKIDDSVLRAAAGGEGRMVSPQGLPLATPGPGQQRNIVFTSQWDNFPEKVVIPPEGPGTAHLLPCGRHHPSHALAA